MAAGLALPFTPAAPAAELPAVAAHQAQPAPSSAADAYPVKRRIRYAFTLQNPAAHELRQTTFSAYAPVRLTSTQRVDAVTASHPAQIQVDATGNQVLRFQLDSFPPFGAKVVSVEVELSLTDTPVAAAAPEGWLRMFTRAERFVESDDPRIQSLARSLRGDNPLATARNIHDWVRQNLRALVYTPEDRGALEALAHRAGDCTEYAYLFTALARASGIPARTVGGFVLSDSGVLNPHDYHNWAEFHVDGAWHPADPHRGVFARKASQYLAMRVISSTLPNQLGASQRYSVVGQGLRVTMN